MYTCTVLYKTLNDTIWQKFIMYLFKCQKLVMLFLIYRFILYNQSVRTLLQYPTDNFKSCLYYYLSLRAFQSFHLFLVAMLQSLFKFLWFFLALSCFVAWRHQIIQPEQIILTEDLWKIIHNFSEPNKSQHLRNFNHYIKSSSIHC